MEPRGAIGVWDPGEARFTLYADVQYPHRVRQALATRIFKIPETLSVDSRARRRPIGVSGSHRTYQATDSPLEGDGFELSVPGRAIRPFGRGEDVFQ